MIVSRCEPVTELKPPQTLTSDVICVLGMHRSGTSLLARLLNLLGVYLGPEHQLMQPNEYNPKGYWEHNEIMSLNDEILARFGGSWDEPPEFPTGWETSAMIDDLKERARELIQGEFVNAKIWGWKDPRSCLTLPFWQQLLPKMRYIVCLRNPVDVVHSLGYRNDFSPEKSSNLWLSYVNQALADSEGQPRLIIFYEDLMDDWERELKRVADFIGRSEEAEKEEVKVAVREFIESDLQHHRTSLDHTAANPRIARHARALYIAQRISLSFRRDVTEQNAVDGEIEKALEILSYSFKASGQMLALQEQLGERDDQLAESQKSMRALRARLRESDKELEKTSLQLDAREQTLQTVYAQLGARDVAIETLSAQFSEKDFVLQTLTTQLAEKDAALQTLSTQLTELSTQLAEKDAGLEALSTQLAEKEATLSGTQSQAARMEEKIGVLSAQLVSSETQLRKIMNTRSWRLLSSYGRIKYRYLLPLYRLFGEAPAKLESKPTDN